MQSIIRTAKRNKLALVSLAGVSYYYMTSTKTQEQFRLEIETKEQGLRDFTQSYLSTNGTRVGLDLAIRQRVVELAKLRSDYLAQFGVEYFD